MSLTPRAIKSPSRSAGADDLAVERIERIEVACTATHNSLSFIAVRVAQQDSVTPWEGGYLFTSKLRGVEVRLANVARRAGRPDTLARDVHHGGDDVEVEEREDAEREPASVPFKVAR